MKLKISTTQNNVIFEGEIEQISLPSENGMITIFKNHMPLIIRLIPWIIKITDKNIWWGKQTISIAKGIALIDPTNIRITASIVTENPLKEITQLRNILQNMEIKLDTVKRKGSIEEINQLILQVEKIKADIQLIEMVA